jgi:hypothetical protein
MLLKRRASAVPASCDFIGFQFQVFSRKVAEFRQIQCVMNPRLFECRGLVFTQEMSTLDAIVGSVV